MEFDEPVKIKQTLRFRENGEFRVLVMSDIQESANYNEKSLRSVESAVEAAEPDLVIWCGDNCFGPNINSKEDLEKFVSIFSQPMEKRGIPWAHVFGNHDHDACKKLGLSELDHQSLYESFPHCISGHTSDSGINVTNFVLPVLRHDDDTAAFCVWGLDSGNEVNDYSHLVEGGDLFNQAKLENNTLKGGWFGILRFEQLMWYWNTSVALEKRYGKKVPGLLCMHIPPHEFLMAVDNPESTNLTGYKEEQLAPSIFNTGLFWEILQRQDIKAICCGHSHKNDYSAEYCGIKLCYDACVGYSAYGEESTRGARLFVINENEPEKFSTGMLHGKDYLSK